MYPIYLLFPPSALLLICYFYRPSLQQTRSPGPHPSPLPKHSPILSRMRGLAPLTRQRQVLFTQITHQVGNHSSLHLRNTLPLLGIRHSQLQALEIHLQRRCHSSNPRRSTLLRLPHFLPDREAYQRHRVCRNDPPSVLLR